MVSDTDPRGFTEANLPLEERARRLCKAIEDGVYGAGAGLAGLHFNVSFPLVVRAFRALLAAAGRDEGEE